MAWKKPVSNRLRMSSMLMMSRLMCGRVRSRLRMSKRLKMSRLMRSKALTTRMMRENIKNIINLCVIALGLDETTKKFTAPGEVWEDYFKSHPTHRGLRNKNCDDYEDLQIVIGNATSTRKNSLGLGDETDARTFGVEDRHTTLDDFVYDETNKAFVANQNEPSHQPPPL
ncbi:hypothetical protein LWI28_017285 [Acer negundo]|uniref:Uncharacterized protein n=1 Tax=Acer negundo TaxID=4023 RepID=A0AAD5IEJ4_ACENE|nr:hypothetical protein LWI28_017285 [Acer negundo]